MATPLSVLKEAKNGAFAENNEAVNLKLLYATQLDYANNMGWVPSGHTSSSVCVKLKMSEMVLLKDTLPKSHVHFCIKSLQQMSTKQTVF